MIAYTVGHETSALPPAPLFAPRLPADASRSASHRIALAALSLLDAGVSAALPLPLLRRAANALDRRSMERHGRKANAAVQRGQYGKARKHLRAHDAARLRTLDRVFGKPPSRKRGR